MIVRALTEFAALLGLGGKPIRFPLTWYKGISPLPKLPLSTPSPPDFPWSRREVYTFSTNMIQRDLAFTHLFRE